MDWNKFWRAALYPHIALIILILPISVTLLACSLLYFGEKSITSILSYCLAFYLLVVICLRIPKIVAYFKLLKKENKYLRRLSTDIHFRVNLTLYGSFIWDVAFATFQLTLGFYHNSAWFYSMSAYYIVLAIMRFYLLGHTRSYKPNEKLTMETTKYCVCGWLLLVLNVTLTIIISYIVYLNKTFTHNKITTITLAAYTFATFTYAIINIFKYAKYKSPVYSATKLITLVAACVSMLTLEATMLTTFDDDPSPQFRQIMLACTGFIVFAFSIAVAIGMLVKGYKQLSLLKARGDDKACTQELPMPLSTPLDEHTCEPTPSQNLHSKPHGNDNSRNDGRRNSNKIDKINLNNKNN